MKYKFLKNINTRINILLIVNLILIIILALSFLPKHKKEFFYKLSPLERGEVLLFKR